MAGTHAGGIASASTTKQKLGSDFYSRIGAKGGRQGHTGGFYGNPERASRAGKVGGRISRRVYPVRQ